MQEKNVKKKQDKMKAITKIDWERLDDKTKEVVDFYLSEYGKEEYQEKYDFAMGLRKLINECVLSRDVVIGLLQIELFNLQLNTVNWSVVHDELQGKKNGGKK